MSRVAISEEWRGRFARLFVRFEFVSAQSSLCAYTRNEIIFTTGEGGREEGRDLRRKVKRGGDNNGTSVVKAIYSLRRLV